MTKSHKPASVFTSVYRAAMESRARQASRYMNDALRSLDDDALAARGLLRDGYAGASFRSML
ncbi:MAG: hypothetical protein HC779_03255 [Phyllobacteriaceae bacterium]|nr:hypothetical protein [Phyllobacteriaceae bacterium]